MANDKIKIKVFVDVKDYLDGLKKNTPAKTIKPTQVESLKKEDLLPVKFQPLANRMFVFNLSGRGDTQIEACLVKKVVKAPYIRSSNSWKLSDKERLDEATNHKKLIVYLHDALSPSTRQQVAEMIDENGLSSLKAQIKHLDPVGTVVSLITYHGVEIERVDYDALDYDDGKFGEIKLTLSYNRETLEY